MCLFYKIGKERIIRIMEMNPLASGLLCQRILTVGATSIDIPSNNLGSKLTRNFPSVVSAVIVIDPDFIKGNGLS
jgi:hypothetical protein